MITIIDYGFGNLYSVQNALNFIGIESVISSKKEDIVNADKLILPGVGALKDAMKNLNVRKLTPILNEQVISKRKKILGLCLGMQLMAETSFEGGENSGLGWIAGTVRRLKATEPSIKIPHVGWNDVEIIRKDGLMKSYKQNPIFYFVHSYHVIPDDPSVITGISTHGSKFVATLNLNNIFAAQFHPEKSQTDGLELLRNFVRLH